MKVVYHPRFLEVYASDPAASPGRLDSILGELRHLQFIDPEPAAEEDLLRVHTRQHIESIKRNRHLFEIACLAAGGAIKAAEIAMTGEPAFALIRPPGHHASRDHCWGFCYFNNIAVALAKLKAEGRIDSALIVDFDLHFGDGTANIFSGSPIKYFQPSTRPRNEFMAAIATRLEQDSGYSVLAVSAGFDRHVDDWGGELTTEDYATIGRLVKEAAEKNCQGRRFAVLEGGYNHNVLGRNVRIFLEGLD